MPSLYSVCKHLGVRVWHALFAEVGHGKCCCDLLMAVFKAALNKSVANGASIRSTQELLDALDGQLPGNITVAEFMYNVDTVLPASISIPQISKTCLFTFVEIGGVLNSIQLQRSARAPSQSIAFGHVALLTSVGGRLLSGFGPCITTDFVHKGGLARQLPSIPASAAPHLVERDLDAPFVETRITCSSCPCCAQLFTSITGVREHVATHYDAMQGCRFPGLRDTVCARIYKSHVRFLLHVYKKHVGQSYACVTCSKRFISLERSEVCCHARRLQEAPVPESGPFICGFCRRVFLRNRVAFLKHRAECTSAVEEWRANWDERAERVRDGLVSLPGFISEASVHVPPSLNLPTPATVVCGPLQPATADALYPSGFGSSARYKRLWPAYHKTGLDLVVLIIGWVLGGLKDFTSFRKKDAARLLRILEVCLFPAVLLALSRPSPSFLMAGRLSWRRARSRPGGASTPRS